LFLNPKLIDTTLNYTSYTSDSNVIQAYIVESSIEEHTKLNSSLGDTVSSSLEKYKKRLKVVARNDIEVDPTINNINNII
jgi:hypothetical protein